MTLDKLISVLNKGGQHLGDLIWWTLARPASTGPPWRTSGPAPSSRRSTCPTRPRRRRRSRPPSGKPPSASPTGSSGSARRTRPRSSSPCCARPATTTAASATTQETRVILDRKIESVSSDIVGHDLAGVIATRFGELRSTHTADDVRRAMMKALDGCAAVTLRDHGGVYWVPSPYAETFAGSRAPSRRLAAPGSTCCRFTPRPTPTGRWATPPSWPSRTSWPRSRPRSRASSPRRPTGRPPWCAASTPSRSCTPGRALPQVLSVTVADLDTTLASLTASVEQLLNAKVAA